MDHEPNASADDEHARKGFHWDLLSNSGQQHGLPDQRMQQYGRIQLVRLGFYGHRWFLEPDLADPNARRAGLRPRAQLADYTLCDANCALFGLWFGLDLQLHRYRDLQVGSHLGHISDLRRNRRGMQYGIAHGAELGHRLPGPLRR